MAYFLQYEYFMRCTLWYALLHTLAWLLGGQPLIIRELHSSSSANCKTSQRLKVLLNKSFLLSMCFSSLETMPRCMILLLFSFLKNEPLNEPAIQQQLIQYRVWFKVTGYCFSFPIRWWASVGWQGWRIQQRWPTTSSTMAFLYQAHQLPRSWTRWILRPWRSPWATLSSCKQNVSTASVYLTSRQIDINTSRQTCKLKQESCWV